MKERKLDKFLDKQKIPTCMEFRMGYHFYSERNENIANIYDG